MTFVVHVPCEEISLAVQKIAFENGWCRDRADGLEKTPLKNVKSLVFFDRGIIDGYSYKYRGPTNIVSIEECLKRIQTPQISVGIYPVGFNSDGSVTANGTTVPYDTLREIHDIISGNTPTPKAFRVKVHCPEVCEALQKLAFANGYKWEDRGAKVQHQDGLSLWFATDGYLMYDKERGYFDSERAAKSYPNYEIVTLEEAIHRLRLTNHKAVVRIGTYQVDFHSGYIEVGCQQIPHETAMQIFEKATQAKEK